MLLCVNSLPVFVIYLLSSVETWSLALFGYALIFVMCCSVLLLWLREVFSL
jgi:hypothetical protein